jgi:flagellin
MTISINSNLAADSAAAFMRVHQENLDKSLSRLSSGSKVDAVTESSEVQRLSAIVKRFQSAKTNLSNAMSFTQTQAGYLTGMGDALERMGELAMIANDATKSDEDRTAYNEEYKVLYKFINDSITKQFNGRSLYDGASLSVSAGAEVSDAITLKGINFQHTMTADADKWPPLNTDGTDMTDAENVFHFYQIVRPELDVNGDETGEPYYSIDTIAGAQNALNHMEKALLAVSAERATVGAMQGTIEGRKAMIDVAIENYDSSRSRVTDVDVAEESTRLAKYNILVQSSTAILAQANQIPQNVLRLIN